MDVFTTPRPPQYGPKHVVGANAPQDLTGEIAANGAENQPDLVAFGNLVALRSTDLIRVPLSDATAELKTVPPERYAEAEVFFG